MEHPSDTPVVERPASPIVSAPMATRPEAPLLAIMFNVLGGRDRWRRLPILRLWTRRSAPRLDRTSSASPKTMHRYCTLAEFLRSWGRSRGPLAHHQVGGSF